MMAVLEAAAAYTLTASKVKVEDVTADKYNFFVTVNAATSSGEYEVAFDVWPASRSVIGSFSAADHTISYVSSFVHKTKANGSAVNMWYYPDEDAVIELAVVAKNDSVCTLSGTIQATRNGTEYTYNISSFDFAYSESGVEPEPEKDPYRFEPTEVTTVNFIADVVSFRPRTGYVEVTLNEIANETYDWIELRLLSDTLAMPAGVYAIDSSYQAGTLTASKGYLGSTAGDDPCYVAIRADKENWGQYTPYYLESGSLNVSYNALGDTIIIAGTAMTHNGSTVQVYARSYNMLYVEEEQPREPEYVTLDIDTVMITYRSDISDSVRNEHVYTMNFSAGDDYPEVLVDVVLPQPMALVAGTYTMADSTLSGLALFQNQEDFNSYFFGGEPYVFTSAALTLTPADNGEWTYAMLIADTIGSEYSFAFTQTPHIIFYPIAEDTAAVKDQPYTDEQREKTTVTVTLDQMVWKDETVSRDGVLDIILSQSEADVNGLKAYLQLGMYTSVSYPEEGVYPIKSTEEEGTFSASLGRYGNVLIPCYLTLLDKDGWAHAVWYIVDGTVTLSYDGNSQPLLSGECLSYFGSTIRFSYAPKTEGIEEVCRQSSDNGTQKILRNGQLYILRKGVMYTVTGMPVKE